MYLSVYLYVCTECTIGKVYRFKKLDKFTHGNGKFWIPYF